MLIRRLAGIIPLGIGISFMGAWLSAPGPGHGHGSLPFFLKLFGVFVCLPFIGIGLALIFGKTPSRAQQLAALQKQVDAAGPTDSVDTTSTPQPGKLKCPNCGSSPGTAEVSPHGDVKCDHCSRWYNVHTA